MASNIISETINENFPIAGQDNDTQVFRENFSAIRAGLSVAKEEITNLQSTRARLDTDNNFSGNTITGAVFQNNIEKVFNAGTNVGTTHIVDYAAGSYQYFSINISADVITNISFINFPTNGHGKVRLEIASLPNASRKIKFAATNASLPKLQGFPVVDPDHDMVVTSSANPVVVDVWSRSGSGALYIQYIGVFV
jgi:hypothetical protein